MENIKLTVPDISCGHCVDKVQNALNGLEGVSEAWADAHTKQVEIEFQPPADLEQIKSLLAEINYPAS